MIIYGELEHLPDLRRQFAFKDKGEYCQGKTTKSCLSNQHIDIKYLMAQEIITLCQVL